MRARACVQLQDILGALSLSLALCCLLMIESGLRTAFFRLSAGVNRTDSFPTRGVGLHRPGHNAAHTTQAADRTSAGAAVQRAPAVGYLGHAGVFLGAAAGADGAVLPPLTTRPSHLTAVSCLVWLC